MDEHPIQGRGGEGRGGVGVGVGRITTCLATSCHRKITELRAQSCELVELN